MTFDEWRVTVDTLCRRHLACGWDDLCGDPEPLQNGFEDELSPMDFVQQRAEKFDLFWIDPPRPGSHLLIPRSVNMDQ